MTNFATLTARLDPKYALRARELEQNIYAKFELEKYSNDAAMQREHVRGGYDIERESIRANREDSRNEKSINAQYDIERMRGENSTSVERMRGENNLSITRVEHENAIIRMENDLRNHITRAGVDSGILAVHKLMDEDASRRKSLTHQIEQRSQLRGEVFKLLAGAVIQEKLAQKQHARDLEKMEKESALRRADAYWSNLCGYILALMDKGKEQAAKDEIDRLVKQWEAV